MQFKKNRAILAAVLAAAMASSALLSVSASAAGSRTKAEKFGDETYAQRYLSLYDDVITNGEENGYLSPTSRNNTNGGFGVPYHAVEECICEAPDYGHETTSEAMSYIVWIAAMEDNITAKTAGKIDGVSKTSDLAKAWKTLEKMIPSSTDQVGFWSKTELSAQAAMEYPDSPSHYPSEGSQSNVGKNPIHKYFTQAYSSRGGEYLLHWLADVDDWYGFGGSSQGTEGTFTFINTFQRGDQESCFETVPHPSIENLKFEGKTASGATAGSKFAFSSGEVAKQWSFTNAPDAEDRAIQAVYAANRWGVGDSTVSANAAEMGDECRNNMFDKYYKTIAANTTFETDSSGGGLQGQHYLMSWYTGWGGAADGGWAWQIGCSHCHSFYQNPLAAYGLLTDSALSAGMKSTDAAKDYAISLQRQLEFYLWLQSAQGPFAGGATNSYNGQYAAYPSGISTFYEMAYIEHPVYADPGSNYWTGNQFWETQRLAELYYVVKQIDGGGNGKVTNSNFAKPGGKSIEEALEILLDKWVNFFVTNTEIDANGDFQVPSNLSWSGQPATWTGTYSASANSGLTCEITGYGNTDLGCANSLANTLIYYAKAKGVEASGTVEDSNVLEEKALYVAQQLMDRSWENGRDDIGLSRTEHNGSLSRLFAQEVYIPSGAYGIFPYGYRVESGATFSDIRPMYEGDETYDALKAAYDADVKAGAKWSNNYGASDAQGKAELESFTNVAAVDLHYHRFWHISDVLMALGTMYELYPEVTPSTVEDTEADWGNVDCSTGATYADRVKLADAVLLAKAQGGAATLSTQGAANADVETDGKLNSLDMEKLLGYLLNRIPYTDFGKVTMS